MLMGMIKPRYRKALLLLLMLLTLTGCRERTGGMRSPSGTVSRSISGPAADAGASAAEEGPGGKEIDEMGERTQENPESSRKEYDENAPAEITAGADRLVHTSGEGTGMPLDATDAEERVSRLDGSASETATETVTDPDAEKLGVSEDAEEADSALKYYTALLEDRLGTLFECKRVYVYWETPSDRVTVHRSSPEHALILGAGAYDVSARLLEENLFVDDGWVARKDPGVIVKAVEGGVLGAGVTDTSGAEAVFGEMVSRNGWENIPAVKSGRVLILSSQLLEAPHLTVAAELILAKCAYPELFADADPDEAIALLCAEAAGNAPEGIYYYMTEGR